MNNHQIKQERLLKRRSQSVNMTGTSKQRLLSSNEIILNNNSAPKQNGFTRPKSTTAQSKPLVAPRNVTQISINRPKLPPPPVASRTIFETSKKKMSPPVPVPRSTLSTNNNKYTTISKHSLATTTADDSTKEISSSTDSKRIASEEQKCLTIQIPSKSTPYTPGLCGLNNIGNTCFMNSALQCLSNIPELTKYTQNYQLHSSISIRDISHVYTTLIQSMWSGKNITINPQEVKDTVSYSAPIFIGYGQKDSHEFMNSLLNALEKTDFASIITKLFHIHTQSQVTCLGCNSIDTTDETTTFLPLSLPRKSSTIKELHLEDLINDYRLEENLDGLYYCHACTKYIQAKQKTNICSPVPSVLIIQLKRFPFDGTSEKIDTFVHYKLQYKDLISTNDIYQLCAVSTHRGSLAGGHYTTLAKNYSTKQWYLFNDDQIRQISMNEVITNDAYILVYLKVEEWDNT